MGVGGDGDDNMISSRQIYRILYLIKFYPLVYTLKQARIKDDMSCLYKSMSLFMGLYLQYKILHYKFKKEHHQSYIFIKTKHLHIFDFAMLNCSSRFTWVYM